MGYMDLPDKFHKKVEADYLTGCWEWTAASSSGYGKIRIDGMLYRAHRVAYEAEHEDIAPGMVIDHLCSNTLCVNPRHLEEVTQAENMARGGVRKAVKAYFAARRKEAAECSCL